MDHRFKTGHKFAAIALALALSGCASFGENGGFEGVRRLTAELIALSPVLIEDDAARETGRRRVRELLARPIDAETAVEIALLNNRGLQADLRELGIAEAEMVQAGRLPNPRISFARVTKGNETSIERKFSFDVLGIVAIPLALDIEERRFAGAQTRAAAEIGAFASAVRNAYFAAVAAKQALAYIEQVKDAADAGALLGRRMVEVGNWSRLTQAREQAFYLDAQVQLARSRALAQATRERLARLLGLTDADGTLALPNRLPDLPAATVAAPQAIAAAVEKRLDIRMAKAEIEGLAKSLGLTQATRFVNVLEASYLRNSDNGNLRETGYEIEISLPLFDWGDARIAKAEHLYNQALDRVAEIAINAGSEIRERHGAYLAAHEIARRYREDIVPLRATIAEEMLLRYNGMLIGVFELLAETREQIASVVAAVEALRDFWMAETDLKIATAVGSSPAGARASLLKRSAAKSAAGH